jgi:succinate dehydrogenase / fumarate reductase, membrane anchor subunit
MNTMASTSGDTAPSGAPHHWLLARYTAIGNLLLASWFVTSLLLLPNLDFTTVIDWLSKPIPATAMLLLIVSTIWHARLGLQVVIEDYVKDQGLRFAALALVNLVAVGGGTFAVLNLLKIAIGVPA